VHCQDQQEIVGTENQRLPQYEISLSRDFIKRGFRKASINLGDTSEESAPKETVDEDTTFTTGLFSDVMPTSALESEVKAQSQGPSQTTGTDWHRGAVNLEKWGSNITNASESNVREESDFSKVTANANKDLQIPFADTQGLGQPQLGSNVGGSGLSAGNLGQKNLGPSTSGFSDKANMGPRQEPTEGTKHKNVPSQTVDKENVGGSYIV